MSETNQEISYFQRWKMASRPKTLPAAAAPVIAGCAIAWQSGVFRPLTALTALVCALLIQIGTNFINDVLDYQKGTDNEERLGPTRVTQEGLLTPGQVWMGVLVVFGLAGLGGIYLAFAAGWPVILIGLASFLAGYLYTGGPSPFAYNGLGDIFVWMFFGFVALCGTVYVVSGSISALAWWAAVGVGALATAILVVNNIRDNQSDRRAGRRNIPVIWGRKGGEVEYLVLLVTAYLVPLVTFSLGLTSAWIFLIFLSIPQAVRLYKFITTSEISPAFNQALAGTGSLELTYSLLFSLALILESLF